MACSPIKKHSVEGLFQQPRLLHSRRFWRGKGKAILDYARPGGIAEPDRVFSADADQAVDCGEQSAGRASDIRIL